MSNVIITTSAFGAKQVLQKGQEYYVPLVAQAGGSGIEIRRELFADGKLQLRELCNTIESFQLISVYSAPVGIWKPNGELNRMELAYVLKEAIELGASYLKASLGTYLPPISEIEALRELLLEFRLTEFRICFTVENDQTAMGGSLHVLENFLEDCKQSNIPIKMTFDIGNWEWTSEDVLHAARVLKEHVVYVHCKQIEYLDNQKVTVPLSFEMNAAWRQVLAVFDSNIPYAIEFPLEGDHLADISRQYVKLLSEFQRERITLP